MFWNMPQYILGTGKRCRTSTARARIADVDGRIERKINAVSASSVEMNSPGGTFSVASDLMAEMDVGENEKLAHVQIGGCDSESFPTNGMV